MRDLHRAGLRGRLPTFIEGFLQSRNFQVNVSSCLAQLCDQEMGIPQGSIFSATLFGLEINSTIKAICPGVECSLYVGDLLICYCWSSFVECIIYLYSIPMRITQQKNFRNRYKKHLLRALVQ